MCLDVRSIMHPIKIMILNCLNGGIGRINTFLQDNAVCSIFRNLKMIYKNNLIEIYMVEGKPYLQMTKWDNIPRAKESKYPVSEYDAIQLHTTVCDSNTDAPLTVTKTETETVTKTRDAPEGVSQEIWESFVKQRKASRAVITPTVIASIQKEADKAGWTLEQALAECAARGWRGFKADWVAPKANPADIARVTVPMNNLPDPALEKIKEDSKRAVPPSLEVLAKMAALRAKA